MSSRRISPRRLLQAAREESLLVRVHRRGEVDVVDGWVVGLGERWVVLAALGDRIRMDGWIALRLRDVRSVEPKGTAAFIERALGLRDQWPPREPPVPLDLTTRSSLLAGLCGTELVVSLHPERRDPEACFIGVVRRVDRPWVHLLEVTPSAEWEEHPRRHALRDITRVDLGGEYEDALRAVAGPAPA